MRHIQLMRFLLVTSFTSPSDGLAPSADPRPIGTSPGRMGRSGKLHSVLPRSMNAAEDTEKPLQAPSSQAMYGRRKALAVLAGGSLSFVAANHHHTANALDMEAFVNSELESDAKNCDPKKDPKCAPQLTADEALCKYGQSGTARGEACKRVKEAGGQLPKANAQGKSLGGAYAM